MEQLIFPLSPKEAEAQGIPNSSKNNREALFPTRLREERALKGVSQEELSKEIGVTKSTISLYENGDNVPDVKTLVKIAEYFNVNCNYLLCKTDIRKDDINIQLIGDYTGLSDETIEYFKSINDSTYKRDDNSFRPMDFKENKALLGVINYLFGNKIGDELFTLIKYYLLHEYVPEDGAEEIRFRDRLTGRAYAVEPKQIPYTVLMAIQKLLMDERNTFEREEFIENIKNGGDWNWQI